MTDPKAEIKTVTITVITPSEIKEEDKLSWTQAILSGFAEPLDRQHLTFTRREVDGDRLRFDLTGPDNAISSIALGLGWFATPVRP